MLHREDGVLAQAGGAVEVEGGGSTCLQCRQGPWQDCPEGPLWKLIKDVALAEVAKRPIRGYPREDSETPSLKGY